MFPFPRRKDLNLVLFTSIFSTDRTITELTIKLSFIIRVASIFRTSNIFFVDDLKSEFVKKCIKDITEYALIPPYLKKKVPLKKTLRKAGLINPTNIPSHVIEKEAIEGEIRLGEKGDFGLASVKSKSRVVLIVNTNPIKVKPYYFFPYYSGFKIKFIEYRTIFSLNNLVLGSRSGKNPFSEQEKIKELYERRGITLLIGPPKGGILKESELKEFHYVYNFIPNQGVKDIRTEEALLASLSILNYILG